MEIKEKYEWVKAFLGVTVLTLMWTLMWALGVPNVWAATLTSALIEAGMLVILALRLTYLAGKRKGAK